MLTFFLVVNICELLIENLLKEIHVGKLENEWWLEKTKFWPVVVAGSRVPVRGSGQSPKLVHNAMK